MTLNRKLLAAAIGAALVAAWSSAADAAYDARLPELQAILKNKPLDNDQERKTLEQFASAVVVNRNDCLARLVEILGDSSENKPQAEAWKARVVQARESLSSIGRSTSSSLGNPPSIGALTFYALTMIEEDRFLEALEKMDVPVLRDQLISGTEVLQKTQSDLDIKWASLSASDNTLDENEKALSAEIKALIDGAIKTSIASNKTIAEELASYVTLAQPAKVNKIAQLILAMAAYHTRVNEDLKNRIFNYNILINRETSEIYPLFVRFRNDTNAFLADGKFDQLVSKYDGSKASLDAFVSSQTTAGAKSDAEALRADLLAKLGNKLTIAQAVYNAFIDRHRGKFFGPVSDETLNSLAEGPIWKNEWDDYTQRDWGAKVSEWRRLTNNMWDVNTSTLSDGDRTLLKDTIDMKVAEVVAQLTQGERLGTDFTMALDAARDKEKLLK